MAGSCQRHGRTRTKGRSAQRIACRLLAVSMLGPIVAPVSVTETAAATAKVAERATEQCTSVNPFQRQAAEQVERLRAGDAANRARAAEALGYLRYYPAEPVLIEALRDASPMVRREAALSLGWCGGRPTLQPLVEALDDSDWLVRQAAWVALTNLTGMEFPYDSTADPAVGQQEAAAWRQWVTALEPGRIPADVLALLDGPPDGAGAAPTDSAKRDYKVERALRAIGALGGEGADAQVIRAIRPWLECDDETRFSAKRRVQAGIHALGRLDGEDSLEVLIAFLQNTQWARYAADALGDLGGERAAGALLDAYPEYARGPNRPRDPRRIHSTDAATVDRRDRIPATAYAMTLSLCRIPFERPENLEKLRAIGPSLVANIPNDADGMMVYDEEPHQKLTAWLLERAGLRRAAVDAAFEALGQDRQVPDITQREALRRLARGQINADFPADSDSPPYAGNILAALCRDKADVPLLLNLFKHPNRWVRINAVKALMFMDATEAVDSIARTLAESKREADYGFATFVAEYDETIHDPNRLGPEEFDDPTPRDREAYATALGKLGAREYVPLLAEILFDEWNVVEVRYAAATALDLLDTPEAVEALKRAEATHDFYSVRAVAREALWKRRIAPRIDRDGAAAPPSPTPGPDRPVETGPPTRFVFIKGDHDAYNTIRTDNWRQSPNCTTDAGPVYRPGRNLHLLDLSGQEPVSAPLTTFADGYVADASVSYDGTRVLFSRREEDDPWWHIYEMRVDGGRLRRITRGPYHHIGPAYLPDGRIVFSTSRLGTRDEYHGYPCTGLAVMRSDGSDIQFIGFNLGRDADMVVGPYGNLLFTRLEIFYSRTKMEWNLLSVLPDGTRAVTLYGPERREYWQPVDGGYGGWAIHGLRHRPLRLSQPQPFGPSSYVLNTPAGPIITQGRFAETVLRPQLDWAVTTPYVLDEGTLLVAAGEKPHESVPNVRRPTDTVDLGIYTLDIDSGELTLVYNDPRTADFGARPLHPRPVPPVIPESPGVRQRRFSGVLYCSSAFVSQLEAVRQRGKLVRVIEGLPQVARHQTHTNRGYPWKNHGGTIGRVLGTVPLAADGSFAVEVPADRFLHLQVLDSDRYVVGNQLLWMYTRPGESKGCVGCHEQPETTADLHGDFPLALLSRPPAALPTGDDQFRYRAKAWTNYRLCDEREERQRTVQSISLFGRP